MELPAHRGERRGGEGKREEGKGKGLTQAGIGGGHVNRGEV